MWGSVLGAALVVVVDLSSVGAARGATFTVPCSGDGGGGTSLVAAMASANANPDADTINLVAGCMYTLTTGLGGAGGTGGAGGAGGTIAETGETAPSGPAGAPGGGAPRGTGGGILITGTVSLFSSTVSNNVPNNCSPPNSVAGCSG